MLLIQFADREQVMNTGWKSMNTQAQHRAATTRNSMGILLLMLLCLGLTACGDSLAYTSYNDEADRPQPVTGPDAMQPDPMDGTQMDFNNGMTEPPFDAPGNNSTPVNNSNAPLNNTTGMDSEDPVDGGQFPHSNKTYAFNEEESVFLDEQGISGGLMNGAITIEGTTPMIAAMIQLEGQPVSENVYFRAHFGDGTMGMWKPVIIDVYEPTNVRARAEFSRAISAFDIYVESPQGLTAIFVSIYAAGTPGG